MLQYMALFCAAMFGGCDSDAAAHNTIETTPSECADFNPCTDDFSVANTAAYTSSFQQTHHANLQTLLVCA